MMLELPPPPVLSLSVTKTWSSHENSPRTIPVDSWLWRRMRQDVLIRDNYACRFCGVRCKKYMMCIHIDGNPSHNKLVNLGLSCSMCDSIQHCGLAGIRNMLSLGISRMPQIEINRKTLQLFSETDRVPSFSEVDSSAVIIAESTTGYANVLLGLDQYFDYGSECACNPIPHTYDMHKGFFEEGATPLIQKILEHSI